MNDGKYEPRHQPSTKTRPDSQLGVLIDVIWQDNHWPASKPRPDYQVSRDVNDDHARNETYAPMTMPGARFGSLVLQRSRAKLVGDQPTKTDKQPTSQQRGPRPAREPVPGSFAAWHGTASASPRTQETARSGQGETSSVDRRPDGGRRQGQDVLQASESRVYCQVVALPAGSCWP
ncbi:uncharacterized protein BKA78DRAFT_83403 [Phyllosticta capitalensis]|uniref:uncharacterized protein n=1 Tax=Phyllosticta capitalensis TaxID=121624 RepID=UPI00312E5A7F